MTGLELSNRCKSQDGCEKCPAKKKCDKWKEIRNKVNQIEPHEISKLVDLLTDLTEGDL